MFQKQIEKALKKLHSRGIMTRAGMTEAQIKRAQECYELIFPPDLRALYAAFVPLSHFYDWTGLSKYEVGYMKRAINWPVDGILFDVKFSNFWLPEWGYEPNHMEERIDTARQYLAVAPKLIPISPLRYLSSEPNEPGNPIFSVHQTDIIVYANDIWDYSRNR